MYRKAPPRVTLLIALVIIGGWLAKGGGVAAQTADLPDQPPPAQSAAANLLVNGDFDQRTFYWRPTNHFVGGMWYEWFWTGAIPEFIDGGHPHHNSCYPPPPGGSCANNNNHSQGYIRYGAPFVAGVYQPVSVTPCLYYRFEAYNANEDANYHTKVGIDPIGEGMIPYNPLGGNPPVNCPPDGVSYCPDPGIERLSELPSHMVWSPESNNRDWTPLSVGAEALSTTITVWTYAAPEGTISAVSTYWDYASLTQSPFPGRLPSPTSWTPAASIINVVSSTVPYTLSVEWDTTTGATGQVWYNIDHYIAPITFTGTYTIYFPIVVQGPLYTFATAADALPATHHYATIGGLQDGDTVQFVILSRRWASNTCTTEVSTGFTVEIGTP